MSRYDESLRLIGIEERSVLDKLERELRQIRAEKRMEGYPLDSEVLQQEILYNKAINGDTTIGGPELSLLEQRARGRVWNGTDGESV